MTTECIPLHAPLASERIPMIYLCITECSSLWAGDRIHVHHLKLELCGLVTGGFLVVSV